MAVVRFYRPFIGGPLALWTGVHPDAMASRQQGALFLVLLLLLQLLQCCQGGRGVEAPSNTDPAFIKEIVDEHNRYRAKVSPMAGDMLYMSWDKDLAKTAQSWASQCKFSHNPDLQKKNVAHPTFSPVGENIWMGSGTMAISPTRPWAAEVEHYNYASGSCAKVCGHYTQVVWAKSYKIGCAAAFCKKIKGSKAAEMMIVVCNYGPAGNFVGERPYTEGQSCVSCPAGDRCENKVCRNDARDAVKESQWNPAGVSSAQTVLVKLNLYPAVLSLTCICLYFVS